MPSHAPSRWCSHSCESRETGLSTARRYWAAHPAELGSPWTGTQTQALTLSLQLLSLPASCCTGCRSDKALYSNPCLWVYFCLSSEGQQLRWLHFPVQLQVVSLPGMCYSIILLLCLWYLPSMEGPGLLKIIKVGFWGYTRFSFTSSASDLMLWLPFREGLL